ncbi:MAG: response regulator transcription factor [Acidiferrobacterales bacterium]
MKKHGSGPPVRARTLIVEDNAAFREFLRDILQTRFPSMEIIEAHDGEEALGHLRGAGQPDPDLIFMDVRLPGENGLQVTRKVKAGCPQCVVAILTSYDLPEYREAAFANGASYFLPKSTSTAELLELVNSVLAGKRL